MESGIKKIVAQLCDVSLAAVGPTWKGFYHNTNGEKHLNRKPTEMFVIHPPENEGMSPEKDTSYQWLLLVPLKGGR